MEKDEGTTSPALQVTDSWTLRDFGHRFGGGVGLFPLLLFFFLKGRPWKGVAPLGANSFGGLEPWSSQGLSSDTMGVPCGRAPSERPSILGRRTLQRPSHLLMFGSIKIIKT